MFIIFLIFYPFLASEPKSTLLGLASNVTSYHQPLSLDSNTSRSIASTRSGNWSVGYPASESKSSSIKPSAAIVTITPAVTAACIPQYEPLSDDE